MPSHIFHESTANHLTQNATFEAHSRTIRWRIRASNVVAPSHFEQTLACFISSVFGPFKTSKRNTKDTRFYVQCRCVFPSAVRFLGSMHEYKKIFFILYSFSVVAFFFPSSFLCCSDIRQNVYAYMQMCPNHSVSQNVSGSIFNVEFKKLTRL